MSIKVGRDLVQGRMAAYTDAYRSVSDWVNAKSYLPLDYDLVTIKFSDGKITYGWTKGDEWQGVLITPQTDVVAWKKKLPAEFMS